MDDEKQRNGGRKRGWIVGKKKGDFTFSWVRGKGLIRGVSIDLETCAQRPVGHNRSKGVKYSWYGLGSLEEEKKVKESERMAKGSGVTFLKNA